MHPDHARVLELLGRYGWNATSFQVLEPGLAYWFDGDDACVAYVDTGRALVVAGGPITSEERLGEVARRFAEWAGSRGKRVRFFAVADRFLELTRMESVQIGEQPIWDPAEWETTLRGSRSLREQVRRSRAKGVAVRLLSPEEVREGTPVREAVERLIARWLGTRQMAPMGFLVEVHPFSFAAERRYFVAEREGRVVGFLAAIPIYVRNGWFFEDLLRDPAAPNGTAELLIDFAMRAVAAEGSRWVTLGLAPLAGTSGWLARVGRWSRRFYDFAGLQAFKSRLRPKAWEPLYLAYAHGELSPRAVLDALAAFSRVGLARFGLRTLLRVPTVVIEALAVLLVPWTIALAFATPAHWFPTPLVKWAWVAFDAALFAALLSLARHWRHWLATLLASLVTVDALLTLLQVLTFNVHHVSGFGDMVVLAVGLLAPSLAAALLWRARWHRRRWWA